MGISTKAIINKSVSLFDIQKVLSIKYHNVKFEKSGVSDDFYYFLFDNGNEVVKINAFFNDYGLIDYKIDGVLLSTGCFGDSVKILRYLCEHFGGYLDENDCDDEEFYPINYHLFLNKIEKSQLDDFKERLIMKVGYKNFDSVMNLFEEFKNIA